MSYLKSVLLLLMSMLWFVAKAQTDRQLIRSGNRYFHQQNYVKAETDTVLNRRSTKSKLYLMNMRIVQC